jgi:hypothetical protein
LEKITSEIPPPSPRHIGIMELEGKCDLIYGAQSLTGKIFNAKDLGSVFASTGAGRTNQYQLWWKAQSTKIEGFFEGSSHFEFL